MNLDRLLRELKTAKDDTGKVLLLINIGQQYEDHNPKAAAVYYNTAGDLSKKINYKLDIIKYTANYTYLLNGQGVIDSALTLNLESLRLAKEINDSPYIAKTSFNVGSSNREHGDFESASGIELCKEVKELYPSLCVIDLSTFNQQSFIQKMLDNGASGYVLKNASRNELCEAIETAAKGKQ